jgi:2-polyprenyl-6-methoxyphenol hydroxylase-like FAD-dependent oxidoreductase
MEKRVAITGAGIAGLSAAIALRNIGIEAVVFESAPVLKPLGAGLALAANAVKAFDYLGIAKEVVRNGKVLPSFTIYDQQGKVITKNDSLQLNEKYGTSNLTIHRADLHKVLLSKLDKSSIQLNKKVVDYVKNGDEVSIKFQDGTSYETDYLIVADGIHSPLRKKLLPDSLPRFAGYTCWRAIIENVEPGVVEASETWGTDGRFGIVPLANNKIYWFACLNSSQDNEVYKNYTVEDLRLHFKDFHGSIPAILKKTKNENLIWNDIIDIKPIHQYAFDNILFIGDAAHATTPNMGQGASQAIEDAAFLLSEVKKTSDFTVAFKRFEERRLERTHYITNTSWKIGRAAQIENKVLAAIRNMVFRLIPDGLNERQFKLLYNVSFDN